ncbi:endonuclease-3 [Haloarcula vallismortis]|uniref:Endonuclease III n=2 Tax=Haloarcula vallismortis TaxID=28442 RepID=M0JLK7_HALVA|nr:endonuclease III [Haloarcula vallismortis]EMA09901.1 endonuclease III [Haloarcula vallismortis ATCC 29715]SDX07527.1 endonuclease-3 [Haloarcula vallismortis]
MSTIEKWDAADVRDLHDDLVSLHGPVERTSDHGADASADPGEGVRQLVTTILSQNVADENTRRASEALFAAYDDFEAIESADHDKLADTIRVAGLPDQKAARIQRALAAIREETGGAYSLAFLDAMPAEEAKGWLTDIKGVGPKTASVVLNFHFGKPTMAVDTHVERVSKRFGLVTESATNKRAHDELDALIPDELTYPLHVLLITHGREFCSARRPDCSNPVCERYCSCKGC